MISRMSKQADMGGGAEGDEAEEMVLAYAGGGEWGIATRGGRRRRKGRRAGAEGGWASARGDGSDISVRITREVGRYVEHECKRIYPSLFCTPTLYPLGQFELLSQRMSQDHSLRGGHLVDEVSTFHPLSLLQFFHRGATAPDVLDHFLRGWAGRLFLHLPRSHRLGTSHRLDPVLFQLSLLLR